MATTLSCDTSMTMPLNGHRTSNPPATSTRVLAGWHNA
jgi:hypothetical protein